MFKKILNKIFKTDYEPMANVPKSESDASPNDRYPGASQVYTQNTTEGAIHDAKIQELNTVLQTDDYTSINRAQKKKFQDVDTKFQNQYFSNMQREK